MKHITPPLTREDVQELLKISSRTLDSWIANGIIPRPKRIGGRRLYWAAAVIHAWLEGQLGSPATMKQPKRPGRPRTPID